ncbi:hypothetical protein Q7P35_002160 [Cladosporium inversicolor]
MPTSYTTRASPKGPRSTDKKLAELPTKAPKEKFQLAKAAALEKKKAAKLSHIERHAKFAANRKPEIIKVAHPCTCSPPDSGSKAMRERTFRNRSGDAKGMKADGHGRRHEGLPGDDEWKEKKVKGKKPFVCPPRDPNRAPDLSTYLVRG